MAIAASDLLTRLKEKLNDLGAVRWTDAEHFRAMSDAQKAIMESRPDMFAVYSYVTPVAGVNQTVPADCYRLLDVVFNCDTGNTPLSGITRIERSRLERTRRNWVILPAKAEADHWMQNEGDHKNFFLVPPQPATGRGKLLIHYCKQPTAITSSGTQFVVPDEGINAIYYFCMHRALEKDEKFAGSPTSAAYMQKFATFLAAKNSADEVTAARRHENEGV